jgi:hypothetical protein
MVAIIHEKPCFTGFQVPFALKLVGPGVLQRLFLQATVDFLIDGGLVVIAERCRAVLTAKRCAMIAKDHCDDQKAQIDFHCFSPVDKGCGGVDRQRLAVLGGVAGMAMPDTDMFLLKHASRFY